MAIMICRARPNRWAFCVLKPIKENQMPRGGKREGAGRKLGSLTQRTRDIAEKAAAAGEVPLDYMLRVMRDEQAPADRRDEMAKAAASYVHPRLSSAEVKSETTVRYVARVPDKAKSPNTWQQQHAPESKHLQ